MMRYISLVDMSTVKLERGWLGRSFDGLQPALEGDVALQFGRIILSQLTPTQKICLRGVPMGDAERHYAVTTLHSLRRHGLIAVVGETGNGNDWALTESGEALLALQNRLRSG